MRKIYIVLTILLVLTFFYGSANLALAVHEIENPLGDVNVDIVFVNIINAILGVLGGLVLLVFIVGGFMFIFAGGNEERLGAAKKTLIWASLGMVVIISSYAILQYVYLIFFM